MCEFSCEFCEIKRASTNCCFFLPLPVSANYPIERKKQSLQMYFFTIILLIFSSRLTIYLQKLCSLWLLFLFSLVSERVTILTTLRQFLQCNGLSVSSSFEILYLSVLTNPKGAYPSLYLFRYRQPSFCPAFYFNVLKINIYLLISLF